MKKVKGFTLIELLIVVAIIAILAAIAVPNFLEAQIRSKVSRVKADQRSLATAIEEYYLDNNTYPMAEKEDHGINATFGSGAGCYDYLTLAIDWSDNEDCMIHTLTTPIGHITSIPKDPFAASKGASFGYYADLNGWILMSYGPDNDETDDGDLNPWVETVYNANISQPSLALLCWDADTYNNEMNPSGTWNTPGGGAFNYDPSNGTSSEGDVFRVKQ